MSDKKMPVQVVNNPAESRFEALVNGYLGVLEYEMAPGTIIFLHTGVPDELEGQGVGGQLAKTGLEYARAEGLGVISDCPFVTSYIQRHPEYRPLLARG
ncbi:MAG: GNAT family N-acetyltransferase [Anaerolineae bacterium]